MNRKSIKKEIRKSSVVTKNNKNLDLKNNIEFSEIVSVKRILKSDPQVLWKFLQKNDKPKVRK